MKNLWIILLSAFVGALLSMTLAKRGEPERVEIVRSDTVTVVNTDTVVHIRPVVSVERVVDSVVLRVRDTVYITLPRVVREYQGSDYYAKVSGIDPKLDYIETYPRTEYKYITQTEIVREKPKKWELLLSAEYYSTDRMPVGAELRLYRGAREYNVGVGRDILTGQNYIKGGLRLKLLGN